MSEPNQPGTDERPISAWLASVLAAAAKSSYAPEPFYVVARYNGDFSDQTRPFDVQRPVGTRSAAEALKQELGAAYGVFGPFVNEHPLPPVSQDTVANITVTTAKGATLPIAGERYDALFYSYEAVEKFVLPLYVQEYGPDYASRVLAAFNEHPLALMAHLPWSEEVFPDSDPTPHGIPVLLNLDGEADHQPLPPPRPLSA